MFIHIHCHSYLLTSPGSLKGLSDRRIPLKIVDFQSFFFLPLSPDRRKILKLRVCKKGAVEFALQTAPSIVHISLFFKILQRTCLVKSAPSYLVWRVWLLIAEVVN